MFGNNAHIAKPMKLPIMVLAISAVIGMAVVAFQPGEALAYGINQTSATSNSVTISWEDPNGTSKYYKTKQYRVSWGEEYGSATGNATIADPSITSYTISGLNPGTKHYVKVEYDYVYSSTGETRSSTVGSSSDVATRVVKPTGVKQIKWWYYTKCVEFGWNVQNASDQIQYQIRKASNGKAFKTATETYPKASFSVNKVSNNVVYTVQIRVKDKYGWSPWSNKAYLFTQPMNTNKTKATNGKLTIAWGKIKGATSYSVFVSNKEKKGYKKAGTVKASKNKLVIKKLKGKKISKKKTYYVYVVANKKADGKTYTSGKLYTYKVKGSSGQLCWTF